MNNSELIKEANTVCADATTKGDWRVAELVRKLRDRVITLEIEKRSLEERLNDHDCRNSL